MRLTQVTLASITILVVALSGCNDNDAPLPTSTATVVMSAVDQSDDLDGFDAEMDDYGPWNGLIVQGVSAELPAGPEWETAIITDPCSDDLGKFIIIENTTTGTMIKVDISRRSVVAEFGDRGGGADEAVVDRIRLSLRGERELGAAAQRAVPLPTSESCDSSVAIPTLAPDFEAGATPGS
jgi:hypothetical protein